MPEDISESLDWYLRGQYLDEGREIKRVGQTIDEVIPVFERFLRTRSNGWADWPYEISRVPETTERGYSQSTSAMILFALAAVSGDVQRGQSSLIPNVSALDFAKDRGQMLNLVRKRALDSLVASLEQSSFRTTSGTFGENDPFTVSWLVELYAALRTPPLRPICDQAREHVDRWLSNDRAALRWGTQEYQSEHSFPMLRAVHVHRLISKLDFQPKSDLVEAHRYFVDRLHQNLSFETIQNSFFDVADLAFSLEGALLTDADNVEDGTTRAAFQVMSKQQDPYPYWRPLRPLIATQQGFTLFPLSVEIANSLLRSAMLASRGGTNPVFSTYSDMFKRYAAWLHSRIRRGDSRGQAFAGWHSEYINAPGRIHTWETSQVLLFLVHYAAMMQTEHIARESLRRARFSVSTPRPERAWSEVVDLSEPLPELKNDSPYRIYSQLTRHFVERNSREMSRSCLLYGPPGTGKSTIATVLAAALSRRLLEISPSDFISRGEAEVEAKAKAIFDVLAEQSDVVILFDEIDRLVLDRDSELYQAQGDVFQFMTPGMLTKLARLWRAPGHPVFLVATNYDERIDPAIKRSGRIDHRFLVLPPSLIARRKLIAKMFEVDEDASVTLAELTPLWAHAELFGLAKNSGQNLEKAESNVRTNLLRPAISLESYRSRFKTTAPALRTAQEPIEEFLLLTYLIRQVRSLTDKEQQLFDDAMRDREPIASIVRDSDVAAAIA